MTESVIDALCLRLRTRSTETLRVIEQLVQVNSHTRNVAGVQQVGTLIKGALASTSLRLALHEPEQLAEHLCFATGAAGRPILLLGHHDTVFPEGSFEGFRCSGDIA